MKKRLLFVCLPLAVLLIRDEVRAQFTDPRNYENTPIGTNQLEVSYAYVRSNTAIDSSLILTGAHLNLNQGTVDYTRYFGLLHRLMWVEAAVPMAGLGGSINGTNIQGSVAGSGDSNYQIAMLVKGGPALTQEQFQGYKPTTSLGLSFTMTAPTGLYRSGRILNLGSDRWSFKPEIALAHPFGPEQKWEFDAYANVSFYTDNTAYHGTEILRQQPLPGLEGHISYSFNNSVWASFDSRYSFRGATIVDGVSQNNTQQNLIFGSELALSLSSRNALVLEFGKALVHQNGPALVGFSVKYQFTWGKPYRRAAK